MTVIIRFDCRKYKAITFGKALYIDYTVLYFVSRNWKFAVVISSMTIIIRFDCRKYKAITFGKALLALPKVLAKLSSLDSHIWQSFHRRTNTFCAHKKMRCQTRNVSLWSVVWSYGVSAKDYIIIRLEGLGHIIELCRNILKTIILYSYSSFDTGLQIRGDGRVHPPNI